MSAYFRVPRLFNTLAWSKAAIRNQRQIIGLILSENARLRSEKEGLPVDLLSPQHHALADKEGLL